MELLKTCIAWIVMVVVFALLAVILTTSVIIAIPGLIMVLTCLGIVSVFIVLFMIVIWAGHRIMGDKL